jgi:hypothetical protein
MRGIVLFLLPALPSSSATGPPTSLLLTGPIVRLGSSNWKKLASRSASCRSRSRDHAYEA